MVFSIVTLNLWVRIFKMFPEVRVLYYGDDETTIGRLSQVLNLVVVRNQTFKTEGNLDFNMVKTMILTKDPTSRYVYERAQHFLQNNPNLQVIVNDFTQEMFTVQDIELLGTPLVTDVYVRNFGSQNFIKITRMWRILNP
jgi:hypothetical protein